MRYAALIIAILGGLTSPIQAQLSTVFAGGKGGSGGGGGCTNGSTDLSTTCGVLTFSAIGIL